MRIGILDDYLDVARGMADWSGLAGRAEIVAFHRKFADDEDAAKALAEIDIVCTLRERSAFSAALLNRLPRLKYIAVTGMRYDAIDVGAATRLGIVVSNSEVTRGGGGVSELAWGLVIAAARHIAHEDASVRAGGWQTRVGFTLRGRTLGVLGLGRLGSRMAAYARAFEMNVRAWSPHMTAARAAEHGASSASLDELLSTSDVVTIHLPLAEGTRGLIGSRELALMMPHAILVNTSRAAIVDQHALVEALRGGVIGGAGLDVFDAEPMPADHPLRRMPNTVVTPHIGYFTRDMLKVYYEDAVQAITAFLDGRPMRVVNPEVLASTRMTMA